jgi:fibronectin-binding autotransporter adhesin
VALSFGLQNVAGTYTVVASNTATFCTGLMSGNAIVSINASPSISVNPVSGSAPVGSSKNLSVTASGIGLSYQWRRAGTNLLNGGTISGATTGTLNINPVALGDAENYDVIVSGTCTPPATSSVAALTVTLPSNVTWVGDGTANLWDTTTANWTGDSTFFTSGDNVTINDTGDNTLSLDLVGIMDPTSITVSNVTKDFTIGTTTTGSLGGTATLTKRGSGKLTLGTVNTFNGKATVNDGTLSITTGSNLGAAPVAFTADQLTLNGGVLQVTASGSINANRGTTLGVNDGTFDIPTAVNYTNGPAITGPGGLVKDGAGSLVLAAAHSYLGGSVISNGTISIGNVLSLGTGSITLAGGTLNATASLTDVTNDINMTASSTISGGNVSPRFNGALTASAGTLTFNGSAATFTPRLQSAFTFGQPIDLATTSTSLRFYNLTGVQVLNAVVSGSGNVHRRSTTAGTAGETTFNAANTYSGGTTIADGVIGFGIDSTGAAGALTDGPIGTGPLQVIEANVNLLATCTVYAAGGARTVGNALVLTNTEPLIIGGANNLTLYGDVTLSASGITTLQTDNTGKTILSGVLAGGSLTKSGAGLLQLDGLNTYTGITTVSNGTIGGTGTIAGPVVIESGGNLAPGASIGVLTVNNTLTLNGTYTAELDSGSATNCDRVTGLSAVTYGGTLAIVNTGPALTASDTFQLFSATTHTGAFASITPATPGVGFTWNTNTLTTDGTLRIAAIGGGPATNPTNIVSSVGGGNLTLSWPSDHLGWTLQTQTNSRSVGLVPATNAWFDVAGSASVTNIVIPVGTANPTVFYRLMLFIP